MTDVIVAELLHSGDDAVRLANLPYIDDNLFYDNWLGPVLLEYGLSDQLGIGDIRAYNPGTEDWASYDWRGYHARLYRGDSALPVSQLQPVVVAQIVNFRIIDQNEFEWEVRTDAQIYNRTFHIGANSVENRTVGDAYNWLLLQYPGSGSIDFVNIDAALLAKNLQFTVTESTLMIDLIDQFATSIGAAYRISHIGALEIVRTDTQSAPVIELGVGDIIDRPSTSTTINAVNRVVVTYNEGVDRVTAQTGASTGSIDEEIVINSLLTNAADAQYLADEHAPTYSNARRVWDIRRVSAFGDYVLQPGDHIAVNHPTITATGIVDHTRITPSNYVQGLEVLL